MEIQFVKPQTCDHWNVVPLLVCCSTWWGCDALLDIITFGSKENVFVNIYILISNE